VLETPGSSKGTPIAIFFEPWRGVGGWGLFTINIAEEGCASGRGYSAVPRHTEMMRGPTNEINSLPRSMRRE
jgi:hypothetical protein